MKRIALLSALLLMVGLPAFAAPPNYFAVKLGGYFPQSNDLDDFDTGVNLELALGHYFSPNVALEFSVGYLNSSGTESLLINLPPIVLVTIDEEITSYPILLNVKGVLPVQTGELYGLAGVGAYVTKGELSFPGFSESSNDTVLGFQLGIGGNFNLAPNVFLGLEGKYFWAKPSFDIAGESFDVKIDGVQATANIGFRF